MVWHGGRSSESLCALLKAREYKLWYTKIGVGERLAFRELSESFY